MGSTSTHPSSIFSNNPLLSTIVTLLILIFLYFPHCFLKLIIFPLLISTLILLFILRLGVSQQIQQQQSPPYCNRAKTQLSNVPDPNPNPANEPSPIPDPESYDKEVEPKQAGLVIKIDPFQMETKAGSICNRVKTQLSNDPDPKPDPESTTLAKESVVENESSQEEVDMDPHCKQAETRPDNEPGPVDDPYPYYAESFVEWGVWGPLEVIYEEDENDEESKNDAFLYNHTSKYPELSRYYPDTDTDTDSSSSSLDEDFQKIQRWEEEEKEEGMFEIALNCYGFGEKSGFVMKKLRKEIEVDEEDNLIEIDISPSKSENEFSW